MISVIVPVFNAEKTIARCLESILTQTYKDLEIIVVDDCSKDGTIEICKEYAKKDDRLKIIELTENKGVSSARNIGLDVMKGEFYAFVDSDDYICEDIYQKLYDKAEVSGADLTFCKYNIVGVNGTKTQNQELKLDKLVERRDISVFFTGNDPVMGVVWRSLFRKNVFENIKFNTNLSIAEDLMFLLDCIARSRNIALINEYLYNYVLVENFRKKYYRSDYVAKIKGLGVETQKRLKMFGLTDLGKADMFKKYYNVTSAVLHYEKKYRDVMKKINADDYFSEAKSKENYNHFKNIVPKKERILGYLMMKKCYGIVKIIYSVFGRA